MAKVITQQTFDDVVKENIVDFSMSVAEAKEETIKQFEAQGINLANIIKDLRLNDETGEPFLSETIRRLKLHQSEENVLSESDLTAALLTLGDECTQSVPHRVLAAKEGAVDLIIAIIESQIASENHAPNGVLHAAILAANAITHKHPDVFDERCLSLIIRLLDTQQDVQILKDVCKWVQKSLILHENNRQAVMAADVLESHLKPLLERREIVPEICAVFRYLVLDDDVRVEFGKAHEHARTIAEKTLSDLTRLLGESKGDESLLADLILTIAALTVRNEFCTTVEEAGGLRFLLEAMTEYPDSARIHREALKLLKALAGNDKVKVQIMRAGAAPLLEASLSRFKSNESVVKAALGCISLLALRVKENSMALFETGISETIVAVMRIHAANKVIQRNAAWAIRNMVSRSREQCDQFIAQGAEDALNNAMAAHPSIAADVKAALRDLGCKVQLKEEWKTEEKIKISN